MKRLSETRAALAMLATGVVSTLVLLALPLIVAGIVDQFQWSDLEVGWLASADMTGSAIASLSVMGLVPRLNWRRAAYSAIVLVAGGNIASIFAENLIGLLVLRILTGAGNGVILSIVFTGLCHSRDPDRYFGAYTLGQLALQALLLSAFPAVFAGHGMPAIFLILACASLGSGFLVRLFPVNLAAALELGGNAAHVRNPDHQVALSRIAIRGWTAVALAAQAIYFLAPAAIWGYFERIGQGFELSIAQIGKGLGISAFAGMAGSLAVIVLGSRFRRLACMAFGTAVSIAAALMLLDGSGFLKYALAACLFNFAWNYTFPYQMGVLAAFDRDGSVAVVSLVVQLSGLALGPALASLLLLDGDYKAILLACIACYVCSFVMFMLSGGRRVSIAAERSVARTGTG